MGTKYEIRIKLNKDEIETIRTNSWFEFMKLKLLYRGRIYYYTVRPYIRGCE